tara:strand:+ start:6424 stop:6726 length:303 start_codon:yes stop_codon:yes gene_type:complete
MTNASNKINAKWDRESANEFSLVTAEYETLCRISRSYPQRRCSWGGSYECNDTTKPMIWSINLGGWLDGGRTRVFGTPGMTVREAKAMAIDLCRRFEIID